MTRCDSVTHAVSSTEALTLCQLAKVCIIRGGDPVMPDWKDQIAPRGGELGSQEIKETNLALLHATKF